MDERQDLTYYPPERSNLAVISLVAGILGWIFIPT